MEVSLGYTALLGGKERGSGRRGRREEKGRKGEREEPEKDR